MHRAGLHRDTSNPLALHTRLPDDAKQEQHRFIGWLLGRDQSDRYGIRERGQYERFLCVGIRNQIISGNLKR